MSGDLLTFRRAACVVAHPDDESMWFAGLILATPWISWTVIACSIPRRDPERAVKFYAACETLGAAGRVLPFVERDAANLDGLEHLDTSGFPLVATHNAKGEYGNPHHVLVHQAVIRHHTAALLVTGYGIEAGAVRCDVEGRDWASKLAAIQCYDHTTAVDKRPKHEALLARYGDRLDLRRETYHALRW